ncbi:unnamed protein product [Pedinophyceae sp. YPF-701]|nr:unnamed protein product [Pedinophyceae sp. YPF-701]
MSDRRSLRVRAEGEESQDKAPEATPTKDEAKSVEAAKIKKGQNTAIWTGAVSIGFGVLYLVLVLLLDTRGSVLEPPPPEALGL